MLIKFENLKLHNFLSFGDAELFLNDSGYTLVTGTNRCPADNANSNGSGKSSIWEAISWALTGETIRGSKDVVNIHEEDGTFVEIRFSVDATEYIILRSKNHKKYKTDLKIYINGEDRSGKGIRDSEKLLQQYLPDLTSSLIGSVIILGQGLPQRFSNNTPSGRKEVLEKLSKSDFMIADLKTKIAARKSQLDKELRVSEDNILSATVKAASIENNIQALTAALNNLQDKAELEQEVAAQQVVVNAAAIEKEKAEADIKHLDDKVAALSDKLSYVRKDYADIYKGVRADQELAEKPLIDKEIEAKQIVNTLQAEIRTLSNIKDTCPTCGQKLPDVHKPDTSLKEQQLVEAKASLAEVQLTRQETAAYYKVKLAEVTEAEKAATAELEGYYRSINMERSIASTTLSKCNNNLTAASVKLSTLTAELQSVESRKEEIQSQLTDLYTQQDNNNQQLLYNNSSKENIQSHLEVVNKMATIISRDFRGFLLVTVIEFISKRAKEYSKDIFETESIDFSLNGNNIDIMYDSKEYSCLSSGEKQKVDLIVQFAIRDMLCKFLNFSSNILVLDEIYDSLDAKGCQKVQDLISRKLQDISSVFIVTHRSDLAIPTDNTIFVLKNEKGISGIVNVL